MAQTTPPDTEGPPSLGSAPDRRAPDGSPSAEPPPSVLMDDDDLSDQQHEATALDERMSLTSDFVRQVEGKIANAESSDVPSLCDELRPADLADLIEQVSDATRAPLIDALGEQLKPEVLSELEEDVRNSVVEAMPTAQLAEAVAELETDEAAFVIEDLGEEQRAEVLAEIPVADRLALESVLEYGEDTAGRLMQRDVFAAPSFATVGDIIDRLRSADKAPDLFYEVFVVDPSYKVIGSVALSRFLRAPREQKIVDLAEKDTLRVKVSQDQEEVAYLFEKYNLISAPVIDEGERLVGMITVDDVVEVVHEEADEDMLALAGVGTDESGLSMPVPKIARSRFGWLTVNLGTAILASIVISFFDATIAQVVALAILMPIVASMGGNAGTQTLTVAVRNLATRDLTPANALRIVGRETMVSLINGMAFAVLLGVGAAIWYPAMGGGGVEEGMILGAVLAAAMIITMLAAGLSGILVPLGLQRAGADPAVSSAVFVTTVTDVVGFFAFLGLAAVFLVG